MCLTCKNAFESFVNDFGIILILCEQKHNKLLTLDTSIKCWCLNNLWNKACNLVEKWCFIQQFLDGINSFDVTFLKNQLVWIKIQTFFTKLYLDLTVPRLMTFCIKYFNALTMYSFLFGKFLLYHDSHNLEIFSIKASCLLFKDESVWCRRETVCSNSSGSDSNSISSTVILEIWI